MLASTPGLQWGPSVSPLEPLLKSRQSFKLRYRLLFIGLPLFSCVNRQNLYLTASSTPPSMYRYLYSAGSDRRGNFIFAIQLTALIALTSHFIPPHWSTFRRRIALLVTVGMCGGSSIKHIDEDHHGLRCHETTFTRHFSSRFICVP